MDVIYRFDPRFEPPAPPATPEAAAARLRRGNEEFARLSVDRPEAPGTQVINISSAYLMAPRASGSIPKQEPFAVVLGCSDARVPTEIVFHQPRTDLFIVRVAGNVLGTECLGSIEYAATHLDDKLRLMVVLGHTACGAVTAAVDAFLDPASYPTIASSQGLRAVIDRIFVSVTAAARALRTVWGPEVIGRKGYREALIELSVPFNAALTAWTLRTELPRAILARVGVVFGVFDLKTHQVWSPAVGGAAGISQGLAAAPADRGSFLQLERILGDSARVRSMLGG